MTQEQRDQAIKLLEDDIEGQGSSSARWAINQATGLGGQQIQDHFVDKICAKMLEQNKYLKEKRDFSHGYDFTVFKNPNYELNENIKATNISIKSLNSYLKITNILALFIAGITGTFIAFQFYKDDAKDVRLVNMQLRQQEQIAESMLKVLRGIDSSIQKAVKDSLYRK